MTSGTMRAAVLDRARHVSIRTVPRPRPARGQVLIRVEGCGVCGSNLATWQGRDWFRYPMAPGAPGHEGWGRVESLGEGTRDLNIGDRVAFLSSSAFAEYDVVDVGKTVRLPSSLNGQPFPGEPLGCAMNILRRADVQPGHTVAILGIGFLGALLTRLCHNAGARVVALSRRAFALGLAKELGAAETYRINDLHHVISEVNALTSGSFCERVIEVTGEQAPLELAGELTAVRGKLVIAGYHQEGTRQVNMQLWNWRGLDVINAHERDPRVYVQGMKDAVDAVVSGKIDPRPLYQRFTLDALGDAFSAMDRRPDGFVKAVVVL